MSQAACRDALQTVDTARNIMLEAEAATTQDKERVCAIDLDLKFMAQEILNV